MVTLLYNWKEGWLGNAVLLEHGWCLDFFQSLQGIIKQRFTLEFEKICQLNMLQALI